MSVECSVRADLRATVLVVRLAGEMDHDSAVFFHQHLRQEITRAQRHVVLDLSGVSFCDSSGMNELITAWRQAADHSFQLILACVPSALQRVLSLTGVGQLLHAYDTVTEAETALTAGHNPP
ncbi:STAS domain-containing protein [Streptomyces sp. MMBL 11-3]|uniref:STAS domain-containing protein n=1 Tax=Streptomyces sp. MMBL 11-3 TaxID=3382639 RepID=UPI0039B474F6